MTRLGTLCQNSRNKEYERDVMPTIKDVAERAGVSIATVSRVMNDRGPISIKTRKKVHKAMEELHYMPNEMARALLKKESRNIGLIVPYIAFPFFARFSEAVEEACYENGYKLMLCRSGNAGQRESEMIQLLEANKVDGIIVCSRLGDISLYTQCSMPIVSVDREIEGIPSVTCDNYDGGRKAAMALYRAGSKKPLYLSNYIPSYMTACRRKEGFLDGCRSLGITGKVLELSSSEVPGEYHFEELQILLEENGKFDGLFINGDLLAANLVHWLRDKNVKLLSDIPWVGFDGLEESRLLDLSTVAQPVYEMGEYAVDLLIRKMKGRIVPERSVLPVCLIERSTTSGF